MTFHTISEYSLIHPLIPPLTSFLSERFVDAPRSEEERLASWGLSNEQIAGEFLSLVNDLPCDTVNLCHVNGLHFDFFSHLSYSFCTRYMLFLASSSSDLDAGMEGYLPSHSHDSNDGDRARSGSDAGGHAKRGGGLFGMISSVVGGGRKDDKGPLQRLREIRDVTWPSFSDRGVLPPTAFQNERFKLIPNIPEGPWVVKSAVGTY